MGFFSFNQEIAIDLGTANTIILYNDKIVVDAPSMVALDNRTGKLKAVGHEAQAMYGRAPENIRVIRPLQNGVIARLQRRRADDARHDEDGIHA